MDAFFCEEIAEKGRQHPASMKGINTSPFARSPLWVEYLESGSLKARVEKCVTTTLGVSLPFWASQVSEFFGEFNWMWTSTRLVPMVIWLS